MISLKPIVIFILLWLPISLLGQDVQGFLSKINDYHDDKPIEKLHVHTDKYAYTAGETIWFKIYNVVGIKNLMSNWSSIAYVDLINPAGEKLLNIKVPLAMGLGIGDIGLVDTLVEGTYRLRAYTNWMQNDSAIYFYDQTFKISNGRSDNVISSARVDPNAYVVKLQGQQKEPLKKLSVRYRMEKDGRVVKTGRLTTDDAGELKIPYEARIMGAKLLINFETEAQTVVKKIFKIPITSAPKNSVQFFPEGGVLLAGGINGLAVKSLREDGKGIQSKSYIINASMDTLAIVETNFLGMSAALVYLDNVEKLHAYTVFEDGTSIKSELPEVLSSGYSLVVNNSNSSKLYAQVNVSTDLQDADDIYFLVQSMGHSYYISKQKANKRELTFMMDKAQLPSGILTVSILDAKFTPLLERPVFNYQAAATDLYLDLSTDASSYTKRAKVNVSLQAGSDSDISQHAAFSAAVLDLGRIKDSLALMPNIYSNLFFNADLKGYIEQPGYYFDKGIKYKDIEYLLLTQGWRRIDLSSSLDTGTVAFEVEKGIVIKGQARKLGRKAPVPDGKIGLYSMLNLMDQLDTSTNAAGEFVFDKLFFPDSVKFLVTAKDSKGKNNIDIIIPPQELAQVGLNKNEAEELFHVNQLMAAELKDAQQYFAALEAQGLKEKVIAIESIKVTARSPRKKAAENSSNLNGSGNADQIITAEDLATCTTLDMCLNGRIMGVIFRGGVPYSTRGGGPMQVILDGMYIEADQMSSLNPNDIASVEVLRNINYTAIYGMHGGNGLIIITSKTGIEISRNYTPKGILSIQPQGLHINKIFYKPVYELDSTNQLQHDLRSTIAWEPNILTDKTGSANFDFYTADRPGLYLIIVEGLNFEGKLVRKTRTIEVK